MVTGGARLRAYEAMGGPLGVLHDVLSWSATIPADAADPGAMQVSISQAAARTGFAGRPLLEGMELALELWDGDTWREPGNGRFVVIESAEDHNDAARVRNLSAPGFGWLLSKGKESVGPYAGDGDNKGRRQFLGVNVGIVILTLLQEWKQRGGPDIPTGFTTATDSRGQSWPSLPALWVSQGEALDATMGRLAANGSLYWWFEGRTLHAATTAPARERTNAVRLRKGREVSEAPSTETISDLIHAHTVIGANNVRVRDVDTSAGTPWGSWEGLVSDDRYTVTGAMRQRNQSALADAGRLRAQYTRDLTPLCEHRPGVDILPGDWITAPTHIPQERVRVASLLWRLDGDGLTSSLILNDSLLEASLARARRERLGEGGVNGGGSDVRPIPDGPDMRAPAAPQGLWATSDAYLGSEGAARGVIEASCEPVTTARAEDGGGALEVASYEWDLRIGALGRWQRVATTSEPSAWIDDLDTGVAVELRVRARGRYAAAPGVWSAGVSLVVESDVTPPPVPSAPVLSQRLGVIRVEWDGESSTGGDGVPPDYALTEVAVGQSSTPTEVAEAIYSGPGWALIAEQPYGAETFIRLRSIDRSGNVSDWGAASSIVVEALVDEDLIDTTINERIEDAQELAEQLRDDVIPPLVSDVDSALQAAAAAMAVAVTADRRVQAGVREPVTADAEGAPVGALWHQYGGTPQRWMATWRWTGSTWVETPPMDPVLIPQIDIGTGTFGDLDGVRLQARTVTADAIAVGGIDDPIVLADGVVTARSVTASEDLSAKVGQFLTVTTGMLEANAVTADKVDAGAITGEKLHVNALNFKSATGLTLTSPTIQTTAETNRGVMLSSNGLEAWNTLGQRMVHIKTNGDAVLGSNAVVIDGSSGRVEIAGDFLTRANSWPNVEIRRNTWADFTGLRFNLDASSGQRGETPELKMNHFTYESYLAGSLFLSAKGPGGAVNRPEIRLGRHTTYGQIIEMQIAQSGSIKSYLRLTPGALRLSNSTGAYVLNGMRAGSSSFNITMDSSWTLSYAGSVRALKTDIAPLVPDDPYDVLRLQPITYRDRAEVGYHGDAAEHEFGLIAEDVAEVAGEHAHLTPLLQHREGELVGLAYDRLPVLLLPLLADMHRRITDLEGVTDHEPDGDPDGAAAESAPVPDSGAGADDSDAARTTRRAPVRGERL